MIQLFNIPLREIDTSHFANLLHDPIRKRVETEVAAYADAKYAVALGSCTDAIFLSLKSLDHTADTWHVCRVPAMITTRFLGAIRQADCDYELVDNAGWVGHDYVLYEGEIRIIDSAHRFDRGQFREYDDHDLLLISNYPTKPLGGLKGGFVISNDEERIEWIRQASTFGEQLAINSWESKPAFVGYQKYMNTLEAWFVREALREYGDKKGKLFQVRDYYNDFFTRHGVEVVTNTSDHLYRIRVPDNRAFCKVIAPRITCGIHYKSVHDDPVYGQDGSFPFSDRDGHTVVSIPFHTNALEDIEFICDEILRVYESSPE